LKISIITIVYNNQQHIAGCIESVLQQTYPDIEHIVIDGASTDGTQAVISPYVPKLGYYVSEKDTGLYNALNKGIRMATGDVVGILHSDDYYYDNDTLKKIVHTFQTTESDIVYANGQYITSKPPKGELNTEKVKRIYRAKPYKSRYLNFGWIPLHTTIYVRKDVFDKYGLYDERYSIASDYDISLRWFLNNNIKKVFLNQWVVKMRLGGKSTTASLQKRKSTEDLQVIREHKLFGYFTLAFKIARKIPQYLLPRIIKYN